MFLNGIAGKELFKAEKTTQSGIQTIQKSLLSSDNNIL